MRVRADGARLGTDDAMLRSMRAVSLCSLALLSGCGLVLDAAPPRGDAGPSTGLDARVVADAAEPTGDVPGLDAALPDAPGLDAMGLDAMGVLDASRTDVATDDAFAFSCDATVDGTACGDAPRAICLGGVCQVSSCGDGFVDAEGGETCEPGEDPRCVDCRYGCAVNDDCATGSVCLVGTCSSGFCEFATVEGVSCALGDMVDGVCVAGRCHPPGCGDHIVQPGEDCDPADPVDGCTDCRFDCVRGSCSDGDACNGIEQCVDVLSPSAMVVGRRCEPGSPPSCTPRDTCHAAMCLTSPAGAVRCEQILTLPDADGDGYSATPGCGLPVDCNDLDASIHPGAVEICNDGVAIDEDCDPTTTAGAPVRWCLDRDHDLFGDPTAFEYSCASPGPEYTLDCGDCYDSDTDPVAASVFPRQPLFFTTPYGPSASFDYDCDSVPTLESNVVETCSFIHLSACARGDGWSRSVPSCGTSGTWVDCYLAALICGQSTSTRVQGCR